MAYLLRKLPNKDDWAEIADSPLWGADDCPPAALTQVFDNRSGVSTWRVTNNEEIERVVTAQAVMRSTIADFAYCLIEESKLGPLGIKTKDTLQRTIDSGINNKHVDIIDLTGKKLIILAGLINSEFDPKVMARQEIMAAAKKFLSDGTFDREFLFAKTKRTESEIASSKDLLINLWKKSEIGII
jgi:hypothetical protein